MAYRQGYDPTPGQMMPTKYPTVGANYNKYGEQPGYIYYYANDTYYPDPKAVKGTLQAQGALPADPKTPSAWEQLAPIAGAGLAVAGGSALGKQIPGYIKDIFSASKGGEAISSATKAGDLISASASPNVGIDAAYNAALANQGVTPIASQAGADLGMFGAEDAASLAPEAGMFDLGGIGSVGNAILPALGAIGAYDVFKNKRGPVMGGLEGAASGAAIGSAFGGVGAIPGAAIGGVIGLGKGLLERESTKDMQKKRDNALLATDNPTFKAFIDQLHQDASQNPQYHNGKVVASQPADFVGVDPTNHWVNNKFAASRNESDLTAKDIWGSDAFFEKYGNDWLGKFTPGQRENIAKQALDAGAVREHHGMIDVDWDKFTPSIAEPTKAGQWKPGDPVHTKSNKKK